MVPLKPAERPGVSSDDALEAGYLPSAPLGEPPGSLDLAGPVQSAGSALEPGERGSVPVDPHDAALPAAAEPAAASPAEQLLPALLEALDRDDHVRQAWPVARWPLTIGRALDNDVVLSEAHVAAHHLQLDSVGGRLVASAGDTRNGVAIGSRRLARGERVELDAPAADVELVVGRTRLRLRLPGHALAPEQLVSLAAAREPRRGVSALLALVMLAAVAFGTWLGSDPAGLERALGNAILASLAGAGVWCAAWALLSKTFTRQGHLGWHLRVFLVASLALLVSNVLPPLLAFAFSWPAVSAYDFVAFYIIGAAAVYFHLLAVEPARARLMRGIAATGAVVGIALAIWSNLQRADRAGDELYMNHLFPPALRVAPARPVEGFIAELQPLQQKLERKAVEPPSADGEAAADGDDDE